jgi:hypothetical protein
MLSTGRGNFSLEIYDRFTWLAHACYDVYLLDCNRPRKQNMYVCSSDESLASIDTMLTLETGTGLAVA